MGRRSCCQLSEVVSTQTTSGQGHHVAFDPNLTPFLSARRGVFLQPRAHGHPQDGSGVWEPEVT